MATPQSPRRWTHTVTLCLTCRTEVPSRWRRFCRSPSTRCPKTRRKKRRRRRACCPGRDRDRLPATVRVHGDRVAGRWRLDSRLGIPRRGFGRCRGTADVVGARAAKIPSGTKIDYNGPPVPALAQAAEQQGKRAALNLAAEIRGEAPSPFRYRSLGQLVDLGESSALVDFLGTKTSGLLGGLIWKGV